EDLITQHVAELVIEALEMVYVDHHDGKVGVVTLSALELFHDAHLKKPAIEDAGQAIEIGELPCALKMLGVLDGGSADVAHRFKRADVSGVERAGGARLQRENAELLAEENQRYAHLGLRLLEAGNVIS